MICMYTPLPAQALISTYAQVASAAITRLKCKYFLTISLYVSLAVDCRNLDSQLARRQVIIKMLNRYKGILLCVAL